MAVTANENATAEPQMNQSGKRWQPSSLTIITTTSVLSKIAYWQLGIVVPLAVLDETDSVATSLLVFALRGVAYVAAPFLGSLIDRFDKRTMFVGAQVEQAVCMVLAAAFLSSPWVLSVLLLVSGFGGVVSTITGQFVLIPRLIAPAERSVAIAKLTSAIEFSKVAGLLLGGVAFSAMSPRAATATVAVIYGAAGVAALLLPKMRQDSTHASPKRSMSVGFSWLIRPQILWLVVTMSVANLAYGALETALVTLFASQGLDTFLVSVLVAIGLFAGGIGSRVGPHILPQRSAERRIMFFLALALISLLITAIPRTVTEVIGFIGVSFCLGGSNVASITYRQEMIPLEVAGRVNAVIRMFILGAVPLSGVVYAWADGLGRELFWIPGIGAAFVSVVVWTWFARRAGDSSNQVKAGPTEVSL
ncbi:MFS transporter [Streptomyces sp. NPDC091972]|uniref:MFS transporter n=1 Tax=Streptomyces sp. NPDC091972 TaxID=3366007 RepID=UPI003808E6A5